MLGRKTFLSEMSDEDWKAACADTQTKYINTRLKQHKWLMRTYVTPVGLKRYNNNLSDIQKMYENKRNRKVTTFWKDYFCWTCIKRNIIIVKINKHL